MLDAGAKAAPNNVHHGTQLPITAAAENFDCCGSNYERAFRMGTIQPKQRFDKLNPPPQFPLLSRLVEAGADINAIDGYGNTALSNAAAPGLPELISHIISLGADVNRRDGYGRKPIVLLVCRHWTAGYDLRPDTRFWKSVEVLLRAGAEFDVDEISLTKEQESKFTGCSRAQLRTLVEGVKREASEM
ncbi:hypothetical protein F5B19DRAFT_468659 [Rostrohypoxylon terebratum]|nr:hypothetical protein F5B19DRAFT_468659 [Rostrohypoxylon terebratum]